MYIYQTNQTKQEAENISKLTTIKKNLTCEANFLMDFLEQCVVNYYGDNTIAK